MKKVLASVALALVQLVALKASANTIQDWLHYSRPIEYEAIVTEVRPTMRDGITLSCHLAVPAKNGKPVAGQFPGIISNVNPYTLLERFFINGIKAWAERGYQGLTCRVRGVGGSEGEYAYYSTDTLQNEWNDSYDLVEWLASQPGSNGRIGQEGASYGGLTSYQAAIGRAPHLIAIAPQVAPSDLYLDHIYPGGIKTRRFTVDNWPLVTGLMNIGNFSPWQLWNEWIDHPDHDRYWDGLAVTPKLAKVEVPVLVINGWDDHLFRGGSLQNYEKLVSVGHGDKTWLVAGPWEHELMDMPSGMIWAWFDYWLKQRKDAPLPPVKVLSHEGGMNGKGWQTFTQWPPLHTEVITLALTQKGTLSAASGEQGMLAFDQTLFSGLLWGEDNITFTSSPLDKDWILAGEIIVNLTAQFTEADANLVGALYQELDGKERLIEQGWLKLSHRNSHVYPEPVTPHQEVKVQLSLWDVHQRIPAGSKLILKLSGGSVLDLLAADSSVRTDVLTGKNGSFLQMRVLAGM